MLSQHLLPTGLKLTPLYLAIMSSQRIIVKIWRPKNIENIMICPTIYESWHIWVQLKYINMDLFFHCFTMTVLNSIPISRDQDVETNLYHEPVFSHILSF